MRFLISCYRLDLSGSSTYTFTLASELKSRGHEVHVFSPHAEIIAGELEKKCVKVYETLTDISGEEYTCIIAQHNILAFVLRSIKPEVPMIFISHGILPFLEQPPSINTNIQKYIAISEKVKDNLVFNYGIPAANVDIVRNFVDVNRFYPQTEINESPKVVLFMSNQHSSKVYKTVKGACEKLNLKLIRIGGTNKVLNTEDYINKADIVISLGRGILEAMACGRAAIVCDYAGGDGIITTDTINEIREYHFSGRRFGKDYDAEDMIREIEKYEQSMGRINREIILKEYNASLITDQIINICNQSLQEFCPKVINTPSMELVWFQQEMGNITPPTITPNSDTQRDLQMKIFTAHEQLRVIHNSRGWKFLCCYYRFRDKIFPPGSRRRVYAKKLFGALIRIKNRL